MADTPSPKPGLLSGLARILHLHQLPQSGNLPTSPARSSTPAMGTTPRHYADEIPPISSYTASPSRETISPKQPFSPSPVNTVIKNSTPPIATKSATIPLTKTPTLQATASTNWSSAAHVTSTPAAPARKGFIVTDYDRILELVRVNKTIKLDEIARMLSMKEEQVAQELQTLEDNGLVEVKYPAFGEPLIYYKQPEA